MSRILAVTGHRPQKLGNEWDGIGPYSDRIRRIIRDTFVRLEPGEGISGMALGVDTLFFKLCLQYHIPCHAFVPMKGQELRWSVGQQQYYHYLLRQAKTIYIVDTNKVCNTYKEYEAQPITSYSAIKMQVRNERNVQKSTDLLAIWDGTSGGTANCVKYAEGYKRTHPDYQIHIVSPHEASGYAQS